MYAFGRFYERFSLSDPLPAIEQLASELELGPVDAQVDPQVALYALLEQNHDIDWVRQRTARRATLLDALAEECWPGLSIPEERERATAGILAAGSFARASALPDTPPLLSMRVHLFFRGIYGIWACMDPDCPAAPPLPTGVAPRPVGKLYMDPRPWCDCGARVLELFSCRHCGLLYLGGIPDSVQGSLWPWSDDLSGARDIHVGQSVQLFSRSSVAQRVSVLSALVGLIAQIDGAFGHGAGLGYGHPLSKTL